MSVNKLIEEMSTQTLAEFDCETRFRALAATGNAKRGLELLDKLDSVTSEHWVGGGLHNRFNEGVSTS